MNETVSAAHGKLATLGLAIDARQIYDVVVCDRCRSRPNSPEGCVHVALDDCPCR